MKKKIEKMSSMAKIEGDWSLRKWRGQKSDWEKNK